jgi:hypothetical protein
MAVHQLPILPMLALLVCAGAAAAGEAEHPHTPAPVIVNGPHREYLTRVARRTVSDAILLGKTYSPDYIPEALVERPGEVVVRVRHHGYLLGTGVGGPGPLAGSTRDAASAAAAGLAGDTPARDRIDDLLIEIEVIGPPAALRSALDWTRPGAVDPFLEPGVDGVLVVAGERARRVCPSEIVTSDVTLAEALRLLAQGLQLSGGQIPQTSLSRFRTAHWYEPRAGARIVVLQRGMTVVPRQAVSAGGLKEAIDRIAEYMAYRQRDSGLFTYQFEPGSDRYSDEDNAVRQTGATLAMAVHARWSEKSASSAAADLAITHHLERLSDVPSADEASFIATADGRNKLGVTALLALALANHSDAARHEPVRQRLVKGMLSLQRPSGMFMTAFPPAIEVRGQDYFPGEALLALAREYEHRPAAEILEAFDRAIDFYREYFETSRSPAFVSWQVQAFALMARHTKRKDYSDHVFALTDYLAERQLTAGNCEWHELHGGIAGYGDGRAGVATASYLEGFADALVLARQLDDVERARRYEQLVREAARFVIQLQVRQEEAYFIRSPQDAIGGIRTAPALNKLRIDHCQHALLSLIKTREALYPSGE